MSLFEGPALGWLALALAAAVLEVILPHFGLIFAAAGAVAAAVIAAAGFLLPTQIVAFAIILVLSLVVLRPRLVRSAAPGVPSRTEQLAGKEGVVTDDINPVVGAGRVNVGGEDWAARSTEGLPAGTRVRVVGADGIVLEVRRS